MITFNPSSLNFYYSGIELPTQDIKCLLNLHDILNDPRYIATINYNQPYNDWLKVLNNIGEEIADVEQFGYPTRLFLKHNNSVVIPDGDYSANIFLDFSGKSGNLGEEYPYSDFGLFTVYLTVRAGINGFSVSPTSAVLHLAKNETSNPSKDLVFTSPASFTISGSDKFTANSESLPVVIENNATRLSTSTIARTLPNGVYTYNLEFRNGRYYYGNLPTKLIVTNTNQLEVYPTNFSFKGIKGISDPGWENMFVYDPVGDVEIVSPIFLQVEEISNDSGFKTYSIRPKDSKTLDPGEYADEILIKSGNNVVKSMVKYSLQGLYNSDYERTYHFTKDSEKLIMVKAVQDQTTFLRLSLDLKFYDFNGEINQYDNRILDYFFFEDKVEFDPGQLIHEMFTHYNKSPNERFNELNRSTGIIPQYQFASIYFEVSEIDFTSLEVKNSYVIPTQFYIKGRRPIIWSDNRLLTHRESQITRITRNSLIAFNFVRYDGGNLILRLNRKVIDLPINSSGDVIPQASDVRIFGGIIKVSDIEILKENDLLELSFNNQRMFYQLEEEGINSINILYKNEWGLLSSFEFTGEFTIDSDYDRVTTSNFKNWMENTNTLNTQNKQKIKINSGFIPKENIRILNEINSSSKVFLVIDNFTYEARPITTKMNNQTSKNNLIDRQLEFELKNEINDTFYCF